ncbi:MAG: response regulator [Candidatus Aminicenantes bacterium]|nr:MAG: response regulator [Candidatus Aminicenantes bacterium]
MSTRFSVLVIEDEEHIREIVEYNLRLDGVEVYLAEDGPTGIDIATNKNPDVILLDWMLPGMDGLQVLEKLKADQRTEGIPVVMLTAKIMMRDVGTALLRGADDYMLKPFELDELGEVVRDKLARLIKN